MKCNFYAVFGCHGVSMPFEVALSNSDNKAIISEESLHKVMRYTWAADKQGYAVATIKNRRTKMHRYILGLEASSTPSVDHINGNPLDNRVENLRQCTHRENMRNRKKHKSKWPSNYKGVHKVGKRFRALIKTEKVISLGMFLEEKEAALAYDKAALKHFGEFSRLNFSLEYVLNSPEPVAITRAMAARIASRKSNSGFVGVSYHKLHKKFVSYIRLNSKHKHIGVFASAEEAARAYDKKARELHGEFARLNFPDEAA